jgi:hypothetical protein
MVGRIRGLPDERLNPRLATWILDSILLPFQGDLVVAAIPGPKPWAILFSPFWRLESS